MKTRFRFNRTILVPVGNTDLSGELVIPEDATSLVIFSHGGDSSRLNPRNNFVASEFHKQNIGTFLFDLLTRNEDEDYSKRFDIDLLTERLILVTKHLASSPQFSDLKIGYFGASTGAASALKAAAALPYTICSVVSRGGRPDLAKDRIPKLGAPTLLIVGSLDAEVLELNRQVFNSLTCEKKIEIIENASHLFAELGALQKVASIATEWFKVHLENSENVLV